MDWRQNIKERLVQCFEHGDIAELDRLLSRNFRESMDDEPEIGRFQYLDTTQAFISATRVRSMQINDLAISGSAAQGSITIRYVSENMDWAIDCDVQLEFEDGLMERLTLSNRTVRYFRPWQGADLLESDLSTGDAPVPCSGYK